MRIIKTAGKPGIATVYIAETGTEKFVELVESVQPPFPREEKWVLIVSTLLGCPVGCEICDAGGWFDGVLTAEEILNQIDFLVTQYYPNREVPVKKFKIQFARMGEPALNPHVLEVLDALPVLYKAPGLMPSVSTVAPQGRDSFFEELARIKDRYYDNGRFQLQFSIHSTDLKQRDRWIPIKKWDFSQIADFGSYFYRTGDRKITLNFALAEDSVISIDELSRYFDPTRFMIKLTPVNPTINAHKSKKVNALNADADENEPALVQSLRLAGYDVIVSIGELEENKIGSNCGQYVKRFLDDPQQLSGESYEYHVTL